MHDIEPYHHWLEYYSAAEDKHSPFYGREYNEFTFTQKVYNYFIHPQWDDFGSSTLYTKLLYIDYADGYAIIELIGEWNDCLHNDIEYFRRQIIDYLQAKGVSKFIILCEHVLNFHGSDECYYEEWQEEVADEGGWVCFINTLEHVQTEMESFSIHHYINLGKPFDQVPWRKLTPISLFQVIDQLLTTRTKAISY